MNKFDNMTVADLRDYARKNKSEHSLTGVEIVSLRRPALIAALIGVTPQIFRDAVLPIGHEIDSTVAAAIERKRVERAVTRPAGALDIDNRGGAMTDKSGNGDLADAIANALKGKITAGLDVDAVNGIVERKLDTIRDEVARNLNEISDSMDAKIAAIEPTTKTIEVVNTDTGAVVDVGLQHEQFETVLEYVANRINVYLVGTSGSGKSFLAKAVADALGLDYYEKAVGLQTSNSDLVGYMSASGNYVGTMLRAAYENGGVFLLDELDAGNPNVLTVINNMTANGQAAFPDAMVDKHEDFVLLAAGNTYGRGADRQYVGRNPIDAATIDRFAFVTMDIDETLEKALAPDHEWCLRVQAIRTAIFDLKEKVICSPRATIFGGIMINNGKSFDDAEDAFIFKGINSEIKDRVLRRVK